MSPRIRYRVFSATALVAMGIGFSCPAADSPFRGRLLNPNTLSVADRNSAPRLYDARTERLQESTGTYYLPDRIYSVYHQGERKWVYAITNHYGKFPEPFEFFYPGSVVEGKSLGAIIPTEHYRLSSQYVWARTPSPFIEQLILVLADPPFFKRIQYIRTDPPTGAK